MRKRLILCSAILGFSIACIIGMKKEQRIDDVGKEEIISLTEKSIEYLGISDDGISKNDLIYTDGDYNYYYNISQGYVERIINCNNDEEIDDVKFSDDDISEIEEKAKKYTELYMRNKDIHWTYFGEVSEGCGYTVSAIGYNTGKEVSGDEALLIFGSDKKLVVACFMPNIDEIQFSQDGIKEEAAIEIARNAAEYYTLNGIIDGSKNAESVSINKITEVKKTYLDGCWFYDIVIDADVEFSNRGLVHKTYEVRIDTNTGDVVDGVAWSLE